MAIEYLIEGEKYRLSYQELREHYQEHIEMTDFEFMNNLNSALHLACIICFLKEVPSYNCLSDKGIIHELTHLLNFGEKDKTTVDLQKVREFFKNTIIPCTLRILKLHFK